MKMQIKFLFPAKFLIALLLAVSFVSVVSAMSGDHSDSGRPRSESALDQDFLRTLSSNPEALRGVRQTAEAVQAATQAKVAELAEARASRKSEDFEDIAKPGLLDGARTWTAARFSTRAETARTVAGLAALGSAGYLGREYIGSAARAIGGGIKGAATGAVAGARGHK